MKRLTLLIPLIAILWWAYPTAKEPDEIVLGQSCAMSGPSKELGIGVMKAANAYFEKLNSEGGIRGKKIRLISLDDSYEPKIAQKNTLEFINGGVFALFGYVGTPTSYEALSLADEHKVPFVAAITGANFLYSSYSDMVVNLRASYEDELFLLIENIKSRGIKKIAILYQNDNFGKTTLISTRKVAKIVGVEVVAEGSYNRNTLSLNHALYEIVPASPEAVVMIDAYKPSSYFIRRAREAGLKDTIFAHLSFVNSDSLQNELEDLSGVIVSQVVPSPFVASTTEIAEYQKLMREQNIPLSYASLEGYLAAKTVAKALLNIKKLDQRSFLKELRSVSRDSKGVWISSYE